MSKQLVWTIMLITATATSAFPGQIDSSRFWSIRSQASAAPAQIKNIQSFEGGFGIVYTADEVYSTKNGGQTWQKMDLAKSPTEAISSIMFVNDAIGVAVLFDEDDPRLSLLRTDDGGSSWNRSQIVLKNDDLLEADLANVWLTLSGKTLLLRMRFPTTSNFTGSIFYRSADFGETWNFIERSISISGDVTGGAIKSGRWRLLSEGNCRSFKLGCVLESKIISDGRDITPPQIRELARTEREKAVEHAPPRFQFSPGGTTRISLNRGFDKCTAATSPQMQAWWSGSPFYDSNIYISGRNRGCSQPQLSAAWVTQVTSMGWGLIPTVVGYQSPCSSCTSCQKHSSDPATAETQGRGEADIAIADANNLGLTAGAVLYYDMERYDDVSGTGSCSTPTKSFLKGWTDRLNELGYVSGVYGSPINANGDWINIPPASQMAAVWLARWNNIMSVWGVAPLPDTFWPTHQRIHQWLGPRDETWGGVTFNIDNNISDAPVAANLVAKNKNADFDGDGKADVSIFRPDTGDWYILNSASSTPSVVRWGNSSDILTPGDFDGDGKTDFAVFRPSDGNWYFLGKAGVVNIRNWGIAGDLAVAGDYNGDGKADLAVFRPSDGTWYILNSDSRSTVSILNWGQAGDKPVQADYDGDGKTDVAVFRPSAGTWFIYRSSDGGVSIANWGNAADQPVQGDYDGDGKADFAVYRTGTWYIFRSTAGYMELQWGVPGDIPTPADFNGDGMFDFGIYRPGDATWYTFESNSTVAITAWGNAPDKPVPAAYFPQ